MNGFLNGEHVTGTKGGKDYAGMWDAGGKLNFDWIANASAGTIIDLPFGDRMSFKDLLNQAADAFLRFMEEFGDGKDANGKTEQVELFIAGESQAGLANQLMLSLAKHFKKVGYLTGVEFVDIKQAVGTNTFNISNALASALTAHFQSLELTEEQATSQQLVKLKEYIDAGKFNNFKIEAGGDAYQNYTVITKVNDIVGNLVPPVQGANNYFIYPPQTQAEYTQDFYAAHPEILHSEESNPWLLTAWYNAAKDYISAASRFPGLNADYMTQTHIIESFIDYGSWIRLKQTSAGSFGVSSDPGNEVDYGFYTNGDLPNIIPNYHSNIVAFRADQNPYNGPVTLTHVAPSELQSFVSSLANGSFNLQQVPGNLLNQLQDIYNDIFIVPDSIKEQYLNYTGALQLNDAEALTIAAKELQGAILAWQLSDSDPYIKGILDLNEDTLAYQEGRLFGFAFSLKDNEIIKLPDANNLSVVGGHLLYASDDSEQITSGAGNDIIYAKGGNDVVTGGVGNEVHHGGSGNDNLYGEVGEDTLDGGSGSDVLTGGKGDDSLEGGSGDDTYHFAIGDGADVIMDSEGDNTLIFGAGISAADVTFSTSSQGAHIISLNGAPDQIVVQGSIEHYVFEDETVEDPFGVTDVLEGVLNQSDTLAGGSGQDYVYGDPESIFSSGSGSYAYTASNDVVDGGSGRDTLSGDSFNVRARNYSTVTVQSGHDTVLGGSGGDELRGDGQLSFERTTSGSYTISVTTGNDSLDGGSGNDTLDGDGLLSAEVDAFELLTQ